MGKRQLAQLQPYEVVITLMISDLATLPMADVEIPLLSGVVSILTLLLVHSLLSALSYASVRVAPDHLRQAERAGARRQNLRKGLARLCFDLSDLMEGMRSGGVIGLGEAGSVVLETNGSLSVFPSADKKDPHARGDASAAGL